MSENIGSTWGKWDFHVHTPYSILNNQYGFNPFSKGNCEERFDEFVKELFLRAVNNNIVAIGITDYFMIEGYKKIKQEYLDNKEKMKLLFPNEDMRNRIEKIYVFPNIELRLNTFVGGNSSVNYHVIFSDKVQISQIEEDFLGQLKIEFAPGDARALTRRNIEEFGEQIIKNNKKRGSVLEVGLEHITVSYNDILNILEKPTFSNPNKFIISVPVDEDLSKVEWNGRDYSTRKNLYQQSSCFLTSNAKTIKWALADGEEEQRIKEFGGIKPCIWGSDAHEYDKMFKPSEDRFCWIKAQPSFEGLLQVLYELATRVKIQKENPNNSDPHKTIKKITFKDTDFPSNSIEFNNALTCIIGGKSTGKSLLLRNIAYSVDSKYAEEQEKIILQQNNQFNKKNAKVEWYDGTDECKEIVYIPVDSQIKSSNFSQFILSTNLSNCKLFIPSCTILYLFFHNNKKSNNLKIKGFFSIINNYITLNLYHLLQALLYLYLLPVLADCNISLGIYLLNYLKI